LRVSLGPLKLANPIVCASGTFGTGEEYQDYINLASIGALVSKTVTLKKRLGNPPPRLAESSSGLLNSIGLPCPGVDAFIKEDLPLLKTSSTLAIISIAGEKAADYGELAQRISAEEGIAALEVNISCPNIEGGGCFFSDSPASASQATGAARAHTPLPLFVKLSPLVTDIVEIASSVLDAGADGVTIANTYPALSLDWQSRKPRLGNITGGLSGPAIKPITLRLVWLVAKKTGAPIMASGGIMTAEDVLEYMVAGATACQIGTANFLDPQITIKILQDLENILAQEDITEINSIIGSLKEK
jgi:dihydroorotate dehydrogenase (NAD+) catalytic subunit